MALPSGGVHSGGGSHSSVSGGGVSGGGAHSDRPAWADLALDFRRRHFLVGLALSALSKSLEQS